MEEDEAMRNPKWKDRYNGKHIVMWDNTNLVMLFKPASVEVQSLTYSSYYNGNVGKGGIFIQLCGWMGTHELWMGGVSDTEYLQSSGILEQQQQFVKGGVPFVNVLDKGYRVTEAAISAGGQLVLHPAFATSDRKFNAQEIVSSAAIAADRSGNERAVKRCKMSGYLKRGLHERQDINVFADVW